MSNAIAAPSTFRRPTLTPRVVAPRLPQKLEEIDLDHLPLYPLLNTPMIVVADVFIGGELRKGCHAMLVAQDDERGLAVVLPLDAAPHVEPITIDRDRAKRVPASIANLDTTRVDALVHRIRRIQAAVLRNLLHGTDVRDILGAQPAHALSSSSGAEQAA